MAETRCLHPGLIRIAVQVPDEIVNKLFRSRCGEPMILVREGSTAIVLVTLTLKKHRSVAESAEHRHADALAEM